MARIYPPDGPVPNKSKYAEPLVYEGLKGLSDEFVVIHSVAWLGSVLSDVGRPIGEVDFLILHAQLGILTVNVKGGTIKHESGRFINTRTGQPMYPIEQGRDNAGGLHRWLKDATGSTYNIGHAFIFPESEFDGRALPSGLSKFYQGKRENICIGRSQLHKLPQRIEEIMKLWQTIQKSRSFTPDEIETIRQLISPDEDYSPRLIERIHYDENMWLKLSDEQYQVVEAIRISKRSVIKGLAGTGKTLIASNYARELLAENKRVLFLTFNKRLASKIETELAEYPSNRKKVQHFHGLCKTATEALKIRVDNWEQWLHDAPRYLENAIDKQLLGTYDALIIDEAQVFAEEWLTNLTNWFQDENILACADDTQVFPFEHRTLAESIAQLIYAPTPFLLTANMRSPRRVFTRLQSALDLPYQNVSLRQDISETLDEIATPYPEKALHQMIQRLKKARIPSAYIKLLYIQAAPTLEPEDREVIGEIVSIHTFRGLEAPVTIVWADGVSSQFDSSLICAFTRATSWCIVIYNSLALPFADNNSFVKRLLGANTAPTILKEAVAKHWPINSSNFLQTVPIGGIELFWSSRWNAWVDLGHDSGDPVALSLWKDYLSLNAPHPIYKVRKTSLYLELEITNPVDVLNPDEVSYRTYKNLLWCPNCDRWTICVKDDPENWYCTECGKTQSYPLPSSIIAEVQRLNDVLVNWKQKGQAEWKTLSIPLVALAYWQTLALDMKSALLNCELRLNSVPAKNVASIIVAVHLAKLKPGDKVLLDDLRTKYVEWFEHRKDNISEKQWKQIIAGRIPGWIGKKVLTKVTTGEYTFNGLI